MITVVTFKWTPAFGYRSKFEGAHVDTLRRMVRRHYPDPHRFVCITDNIAGIREPDVECFELWPDLANVLNPSGAKNPSCYRRLRLFAHNTGRWLGERFVCLDLDCVLTGDVRPLWNRPEDFVIWRSSTRGNAYNGSMFLASAGAREQLWTDFDPMTSPAATRQAGLYGSDQAWIAFRLGLGEATWGRREGVYSFRIDLQPKGGALPRDSRIVFFHGKGDPWSPDVYARHPWIKEHYR